MPVDLMIQEAARKPPRRPFVLTGRHVLAAMVAFFVVVAGVNALMMTMAIRTMPGLDARNGYETSQRFNAELARMDAQDRQAWIAELRLTRQDGSADIMLKLLDRQRAAVDGLAVTARLLHPASRHLDREATLAPMGSGLYTAQLRDLSPGAWRVSISADRDGRTVFTSQNRVFLKD